MTWLIDEARAVVEVDGARDTLGVGDVAAERGHFILAGIPGVTHAQAAFDHRLAGELGCLIQEEVDLAAVSPVREDEEFAVFHRDRITARGGDRPLRRLRQWIAVDDGVAGGVDRIGDGAALRTTGSDRQARILDFREVVAAAQRHLQARRDKAFQFQLGAAAVRLRGIDQARDVRRAAHHRQLLVFHLVVIHAERDAGAAVEQIGLDTGFVRSDGFRIGNCHGHLVAGRGDTWRAETSGDTGVEVHVLVVFIGTAQVPVDLGFADIGAGRVDLHDVGRFHRVEILLVLGVAQAGAQHEVIVDGVVDGTERGPGRVLLAAGQVRGQHVRAGIEVVGETVGIFVEVVHACLPVQRTGIFRFGAEFLRVLFHAGDAAGRFNLERNEAGARRRAAVDVAMRHVTADLFKAGDRVQLNAVQVPAQAGAGAVGAQALEIRRIRERLVRVETVDDVVRALLDQVGVEDARAARGVALVHIEQGIERGVRRVQQLHAFRVFVVAVQRVFLARKRVVDVVVAVLAQGREAQRPFFAQRHVDGAVKVGRVVRGGGNVVIAFNLVQLWLDGFELDHAGGRIAAEQGALRAAQHFHAGHVENRVALEDRIFLHDIVVNQGNRLRCKDVEVGIAIAADVEAGEGAAVRRFHVQARHLAGQHADVLSAGDQHVELLVAQQRHGDGHVADIFLAALRRDGHGFQLAGGRGRISSDFISIGRADRQGSGQCQHSSAFGAQTLVHLGHLDHVVSQKFKKRIAKSVFLATCLRVIYGAGRSFAPSRCSSASGCSPALGVTGSAPAAAQADSGSGRISGMSDERQLFSKAPI